MLRLELEQCENLCVFFQSSILTLHPRKLNHREIKHISRAAQLMAELKCPSATQLPRLVHFPLPNSSKHIMDEMGYHTQLLGFPSVRSDLTLGNLEQQGITVRGRNL